MQEANAVCAQHREMIEAAASQVLAGGSLPSPEQFGRLTMQTELNDKATQTGSPTPAASDLSSVDSPGLRRVDGRPRTPGGFAGGLPGVHNKQVLIRG